MKYLWLTLRHKWFVLVAGVRVGVPLWRLVVHDWTKFLPSELPHYQRQFFGKANDSLGFIMARTRHQNRNEHHWEYWIPRTGHSRCDPAYPDGAPIPMPQNAIYEMCADWMAACRAYEGHWPEPGQWEWLEKNLDKVARNIHPSSRRAVIAFAAKYMEIPEDMTDEHSWPVFK